MQRKRRALVIAHESDALPGQVGVRLEQRGFELDVHVVTPDRHRPNDPRPWPDPALYDAVVPMGSIRNLPRKQEIDAWVHDELRALRDAHERDQPMLGICFGGQLLAEALGGSVEEAPDVEIGWFALDDGPDGSPPTSRGPWFQLHHDRFVPPSDAQVLAATERATQLFRLGRSVGTQFHPEVDVEHVERWLSHVDDAFLDARGTTRDGLLAATRLHEAGNIARCHEFVDWWLDEVAFPPGAD